MGLLNVAADRPGLSFAYRREAAAMAFKAAVPVLYRFRRKQVVQLPITLDRQKASHFFDRFDVVGGVRLNLPDKIGSYQLVPPARESEFIDG